MNVREIDAFQAVMVCGTASRAADVLGISQPAVSKAIQSLEASIGFALFERVKGRLLPTPEGQLFHREVEQSFAGLARLRSAATRFRVRRSARRLSVSIQCQPIAKCAESLSCQELEGCHHVPGAELADDTGSRRLRTIRHRYRRR